jgi:hypothetical protein
LVDYLDFFEEKANGMLIEFTEDFKRTTQDFKKFMSLGSTEDLPEMLSVLLKFAQRHTEFI